ncbi:hypothetical protein ACOMHN_039701 [Nucella lapillus]
MDDFSSSNASTDSSVQNESTTAIPLTSFTIYVTAIYLWNFLAPLILLLGTFGNVIAIVIMRRTTSEDSTVDVYLLGMAVMDLIFLYTLTLKQLVGYTFGYRIDASHSVVCKVSVWLYTASGTISCWYLVCLTLHRAMSVVWPHRVSVICTRRTVLRLVVSIAVFFALVYSHALVGMDRVYNKTVHKCMVKSVEYMNFLNVFIYVELCLYCLFPFACLVSGNIVLVWKLAASVKKARGGLTQTTSQQTLTREKNANSVTLTVIVVSLTFLVLTLPTSVNFIQTFLPLTVHTLSVSEYAELFFVATVRSLLGHSNAAINFYLYCLTGRRFREEFFKIVSCGRRGRVCGESSSVRESNKRAGRHKKQTNVKTLA